MLPCVTCEEIYLHRQNHQYCCAETTTLGGRCVQFRGDGLCRQSRIDLGNKSVLRQQLSSYQLLRSDNLALNSLVNATQIGQDEKSRRVARQLFWNVTRG